MHVSGMVAMFMHVLFMKHYFHAWNMHEPRRVQNISIALRKTCMWQVYHGTMHEIFMKFHITSYWLETAALQIWKRWDFKKASMLQVAGSLS